MSLRTRVRKLENKLPDEHNWIPTDPKERRRLLEEIRAEIQRRKELRGVNIGATGEHPGPTAQVRYVGGQRSGLTELDLPVRAHRKHPVDHAAVEVDKDDSGNWFSLTQRTA